jgi:spore coat polysaccharide biosynthesis predicted glycosyltransferase SpsG
VIKIAIYCDLSRSSGLGHLYRMKNLSKELEKKGSKCFFLFDKENKKFIYKYISSQNNFFFSKKNKISSIKKILSYNNFHCLIIDSYENNLRLEKILVKQDYLVISVDDHLKEHFSNVVVTNRILEKKKIRKKTNQLWLTGNKYILVNKHSSIIKKKPKKNKRFKLLLHAGGSSSYNRIRDFTITTLETVRKYNIDTTILCTTIDSQKYVKKLLIKKGNFNKVKIVNFIKDLSQKLSKYHLVAGPMGTTTLETILAGSFPFTVPIKDDGRDSLNTWHSIGHFAHLSSKQKKNQFVLTKMWTKIIDNYDQLLQKLKKNSKEIDGFGPRRLAKKIIFLLKQRKKIKIRSSEFNQ